MKHFIISLVVWVMASVGIMAQDGMVALNLVGGETKVSTTNLVPALTGVMVQSTANSVTGALHTAAITNEVSQRIAGDASVRSELLNSNALLRAEIDGISVDERDPRFMKEFHYGDPDIIITPTNAFTFSVSGGEATITGYSGDYADIVIPYEFYGVPVIGVIAVGEQSLFRYVDGVITCPKSLISIGANAFSYCSASTINIYGVIPTIGYAFSSCSASTINLPSATSIGDYAFSYCSASTINLPSATSIGDYAFNSCSSIIIDLPYATSIGANAFSYCSASTIILPSATSIGANAFSYCSASTINLPSATSIGNYAFYFCSASTINLPSATSIGNSAFSYCPGLTSIYYGLDKPIIAIGAYDNIQPNLTNYVTNPQAQGWGDEFGGRPVVFPNGRYDDVEVKNITVKDSIYVHDSGTNLVWRNVYSNGWHWLIAYTNTPAGGQ